MAGETLNYYIYNFFLWSKTFVFFLKFSHLVFIQAAAASVTDLWQDSRLSKRQTQLIPDCHEFPEKPLPIKAFVI